MWRKKILNEGNQIHNFISSSGSDFLTSYGSGSNSQKVTVPTVPVPQHWYFDREAKKKHCTGNQKQLYKQSYYVVKHGRSYSLKKYSVDICSFCTNIGFAGFNHYWAMLDCPWPSVSDWPWCWNAGDYTLWLKHYLRRLGLHLLRYAVRLLWWGYPIFS